MAILETRGRTALIRHFAAENVTKAGLARDLGIAAPSVWSWAEGRSRPEAHLRIALERVLAIPRDDWMTDEEYLRAYGHAARPPEPIFREPLGALKPTGTTGT